MTGKAKRVIVYHAQCHDGITALWAAKQKWPDAEAYPARYGDTPDYERLQDADIVIVDFSWPREALRRIYADAQSLRVLDHHETAWAALAGLDFCTFDMERSGAGLAWDEFVGGPRPWLIDHVEDRDLWRFALPETEAIHAYCTSFPLTLEARDELMKRTRNEVLPEGRAILRYHRKLVESAARHSRYEVIGGYRVPSTVCMVRELVSDVAHVLAKNAPFAAVYADLPDGTRHYSLRSEDSGVDVASIAALYGGGGHRHAAGFTVPDGVLGLGGSVA